MAHIEIGAAGESPLRQSFRTHASYLRAFSQLLGAAPFSEPDDILPKVARRVASIDYGSRRAGVDSEVVLDCLNRAWGTELVLSMSQWVMTTSGTELLRLSNSWGAVQAYYVAYSATQALVVAHGFPRPESHPSTQRRAIDLWVTRRVATPPWSFAVASPTDQRATCDGAINGPGRPLDRDVHNWSRCTSETSWDIAANALRSTRQDAVDELLKKRRKEKLSARKRSWRSEQQERLAIGKAARKEPPWPAHANLTPDEAADATGSVRPYTLLDYLYRLRIKANYEDARMFTEGPDDDYDTGAFASDLQILTSGTLLAHELRVARLLGTDTLLSAADTWLKRTRSTAPLGLAARRSLLGQYVD